MTPRDLQSKAQRLQGQRDQLQTQRDQLQVIEKRLEARKTHVSQARALIQQVALTTQDQLKYHISEIVSLALEAVFPEPYTLQVDFVERRGRTECDLTFSRDGESISPLSASGGGAVDVTSFALRVALWAIQSPRPTPVMILDEPFKHLSSVYHEQAAQMLRELASELGLQIIMVTHNPVLAQAGDRVFQVGMKKGVSTVSQARS